VVEYSTTTLVPPGARCRVDGWHNLVLEWVSTGAEAARDGGETPRD